jgi:hypothetical protein
LSEPLHNLSEYLEVVNLLCFIVDMTLSTRGREGFEGL